MKSEMFRNSDADRLQKEVNKWLDENPSVVVRFVSQSESDSNVTLSIFYDDVAAK